MSDLPTLDNPQYLAFAEAYLQCFDQTKAAIEAKYAKTSARNQGYRLMQNDDIRAYIRARMRQAAMDADEVLFHLAAVARGQSYDKVKALELLAKHHELLVERIKVDSWQDKIVALLKDGKITPEQAQAELGQSLAEDLFKRAGISVTTSREG